MQKSSCYCLPSCQQVSSDKSSRTNPSRTPGKTSTACGSTEQGSGRSAATLCCSAFVRNINISADSVCVGGGGRHQQQLATTAQSIIHTPPSTPENPPHSLISAASSFLRPSQTFAHSLTRVRLLSCRLVALRVRHSYVNELTRSYAASLNCVSYAKNPRRTRPPRTADPKHG